MEKLTKYRNLAIATSHLWKKHTLVVPVVIGGLETISRNFTQYYKQLQITATTIRATKNSNIRNSIHTVLIFNRYLGFWLKLVSVISVVPNFGPPDVLGLQLPEILPSRGGGEGFWEL